MKNIVLFVFAVLVSYTASVQASPYYGECNLLIQIIQAAPTWRKYGMDRSEVPKAIDRNMSKTEAGRVATNNERTRWHDLASLNFDGTRVTDDDVAKSVGRFCKPPFLWTEAQAVGAQPPPTKITSVSASNEDPGMEFGYADKPSVCLASANLFEQAGYQRDQGNSPEHALKFVHQVMKIRTTGKFSIPESQIKHAINLMYFDPDLVRVGGNIVNSQVFDLCMRDWKVKTFTPLK